MVKTVENGKKRTVNGGKTVHKRWKTVKALKTRARHKLSTPIAAMRFLGSYREAPNDLIRLCSARKESAPAGIPTVGQRCNLKTNSATMAIGLQTIIAY
jgi:hypothetical protein